MALMMKKMLGKSARQVSTTASRGIATVSLPDLPYDFGALEPAISGEIMQLHHQKHHQAYVTNYNAALEQYAEAEQKKDVAKMIALQPALRFNGGGHVNHSIFWTNLAPVQQGGGGEPEGELRKAIDEEFGSFESFKKTMSAKSAAVQGSGWGWLGYNKEQGRVGIVTCSNQDPCSTTGYVPLLGIDVWEHAYYLQYKNVRPDYLNAIWKVVNWKNVGQRFTDAQNHLRATLDKCNPPFAEIERAQKTQSKMATEAQNPSLDRTFRGHKSAVTSVSWHPNVQQLASSSLDGCVMIWNFRPHLRAFRYVGHQGPVYATCFSPSGDLLASASQDRTVRLWTPTVKGDSVTIKAHAGAIRSVVFSYCGKELLTASDDMSIKLWALPTRRFQCSLTGHSNWVRSAKFSPDARLVVSGSDDKTVKLWDKSMRYCLQTFYEHTGIVNSVAFHPDGTTIASGSYDRSVNLWDVRKGTLVQHYKAAHDANVTSINFHPSGNYLLSTSTDQTIKIWDVREGQVLYTMHGHDGAVNCGAFSPNSKLLASGSVDSFVMVWDADLDKCLQGEDFNANVVPSPAVQAWRSDTSSVISRNAVGRSDERTRGVTGVVPSPQRSPSIGSAASFSSGRSVHSISPPSSLVGNNTTGSSRNGRSGPSSQAHVPVSSPPPTPSHVPTPQKKPQYPDSSAYYEVRPLSASLTQSYSARDRARSDSSDTNGTATRQTPGTRPPVSPVIPSAPRITNSSTDMSTEQTSANMANTLQHIVGQLEIITRTLSVLEERISINEDRITDLTKVQKELLQRQQHQNGRRSFEQERQ